MKTRQPLILTARIAEQDLQPFDRLRQLHFPPDRNFLRAHLTMFHRLPGEYWHKIVPQIENVSGGIARVEAEVTGLRHLGAGVAYVISSPALQEIRAALKTEFVSWLGPQDMQAWWPHITIQNRVSTTKADTLFRNLSKGFRPHPIEITGFDLWDYLGGPWQNRAYVPLSLHS